ncbi:MULTISPECIES: TIGR00282 family metallophosphoesterase [Anaerotruncus]|jgi:metallophosphoesterase (TIGR00282 family)|uniref:TIGR00282 family metallophosphoesterase n=1 Tax=Anaerotruncus TaxID=244127 RepID=UPI00082FABC0|nr:MULTISPECIES: TIGR00282 family metallophosphoesterase [Anaerotruncus]RGX54575.1 TIGR00282 family metallophosphoesterase [Anaerotruncus sp. AF02-27]
MNILFFGDVVGQAGCDKLRKELPRLKKEHGAGIVIANGENSAEGNGITPHSAQHLFDSGVDVITTGNHSLRRREIYELLDERKGVIRPANYHAAAPGSGIFFYDSPAFPLCVLNLQGRVYMDTYGSPFSCADALLEKADCPNIIVDFHAEATAEKLALAHYLDGRVSAVIGTHTHVQTADERLLPNGTAYITDAGMCGGRNSILGVVKEKAIEKLRTGLPTRFSNDPEAIELHGVLLTFSGRDGKVTEIKRIAVKAE